MLAIVLATGYNAEMAPLTDWYPTPLLPIVDRPVIQHVVENLVDKGITEIDFVFSHQPHKLEVFLGDGARWGCSFRFHLARDPERPYAILKTIPLPDELITLAHADRLPFAVIQADADTTVVYVQPPPHQGRWTGWALVPRAVLTQMPDDLDEEGLGVYLTANTVPSNIQEVTSILSARSFEELLKANRVVLAGEFPVRLLTGTQTEKGIWISRNVSLHPTTRLVPPVFIGENCRIGMAARLGPNVVIEHDCILDNRCTVQDSLIFQNSYVGESLDLSEAIVDRNRLVNTRVGVAVSITDDFLLGSLSEGHMQQWTGRKLSQTLGVVLAILTLPLLLATALVIRLTRRGPVFHRSEAVALPTQPQEWEWRTFSAWRFSPEEPAAFLARRRFLRGLRHCLLYVLPGLINIAKGELRFVGVPPRSKEQILGLSHDWQTLYLDSKPGMITETDIYYFGVIPSEDEVYSAEAFYTVNASAGYDLKLLWKYLGYVLNPFG